jgi:uncharacterized protein YdeI (YjbR/CyaY-like superfamily)
MSKQNHQVDGFIRKHKRWEKELEALRRIALDCDLTEEVKWRIPCYTFEGNNVVLIGAFKEYCAMSFMKGALLKDAKGILARPGENTRAARLVRFTTVQEITRLKPVLKAYIKEGIELEKAGLKVDFKENAELPMPKEIQDKLDQTPALKAAFHALTPGRRRGYLLHFSAPKQAKTRVDRLEKYAPLILKGMGMHDEYRAMKK